MKDVSPLQFAVVREDPGVELDVVDASDAQRILMIASGGCTLLSLLASSSTLHIDAVDPNPSQLDLCRRKLQAWATSFDDDGRLTDDAKPQWGIGHDAEGALHTGGNFETLFQQLRQFLHAFVVDEHDLVAAFANDTVHEFVTSWSSHPYWVVAFELFFSDALLNQMFTPAATQHAPAGSYPSYFRCRLEQALSSSTAGRNPYLQHVFLGHYLDDEHTQWPLFLTTPSPTDAVDRVAFHQTLMQDAPAFGAFDVVTLSNILDWMNDDAKDVLAQRLREEMAAGAWLITRQLNNPTDLADVLGDAFAEDDARSAHWTQHESAAFYERVRVWRKR